MSAGLLRTVAPYLIGAGILGAAALGVRWYGHSEYQSGVTDERARIEKQQAAIERGMQEERDRADAQYRGAVLARQALEHRLEAANRDRAAAHARIRGLLDQYANRADTARASGGPDEAGPDWIGIFGECVARSERLAGRLAEVGADAARWADQVTGLQGYARAVLQPAPPD